MTGGDLELDDEDIDGDDSETSAAYFFSKDSGFVKTENMPSPRSFHACGVHQGQVVVAGGLPGLPGEPGRGPPNSLTSDYFSLDTLTWHRGPNLERKQGVRSDARSVDFVSWNKRAFLIGEQSIWELKGTDKTTWKWETVAEMETYRKYFKAFVMPAKYCRG